MILKVCVLETLDEVQKRERFVLKGEGLSCKLHEEFLQVLNQDTSKRGPWQ